ncbi:hypothetical protein M9Y10_016626 [Tritrichomonas musculus]|uniref:Uncharacterized protein n=1 Tax=Tritrichomonas musculus TaxID=1915356 RepID=A0ABR2HX47_9EUKA
MSEHQQNKETLDLINQGVQLKKVDAPPERPLPSAAEIAEAKKRAEEEGPEVDPSARPKAGDGRTMLELIKDGDVKLKRVRAPGDRPLPSAAEIAEAKKRAEEEGPEVDPSARPKAGDGRTMLELIKDGDVKLKPVDKPGDRPLPSAAEIAEAKKRAEEEGPEVDPSARPKAGDGRTMLELIKDGDVKLKHVETKEPRLPTAEEIKEQKRIETEGGK